VIALEIRSVAIQRVNVSSVSVLSDIRELTVQNAVVRVRGGNLRVQGLFEDFD
jgi:DeoR/GlpR family transcriptional regulator of sugar metabolism